MGKNLLTLYPNGDSQSLLAGTVGPPFLRSCLQTVLKLPAWHQEAQTSGSQPCQPTPAPNEADSEATSPRFNTIWNSYHPFPLPTPIMPHYHSKHNTFQKSLLFQLSSPYCFPLSLLSSIFSLIFQIFHSSLWILHAKINKILYTLHLFIECSFPSFLCLN